MGTIFLGKCVRVKSCMKEVNNKFLADILDNFTSWIWTKICELHVEK